MTVNSADEVSSIARGWAAGQYGISPDSVNVFSVIKATDNLWYARIRFILNNEEKTYGLSIDENGSVVNSKDLHSIGIRGELPGSTRTMILIAEIFSALFVLLFLVEAIVSIFSLILFSVLYIIFLLIGIYVLINIAKIRSSINSGDLKAAYDRNTVGLGVIAVIFNGMIPGILLLISRGDLQSSIGI